jgi:hypothetical protein
MFCVSQTFTIFHKTYHQLYVVVLPFKNHSRLFPNRTIEKETRQQTGQAPFVTVEEHAATRLLTLLTLDGSSKMTHPK